MFNSSKILVTKLWVFFMSGQKFKGSKEFYFLIQNRSSSGLAMLKSGLPKLDQNASVYADFLSISFVLFCLFQDWT